LAYKNGYDIEWKNLDQAEIVQASIASFKHGDYSKLAAAMRANIRELGKDEETGG
jgi:fido (protein-threonine AMPylation protein)